MKQHDVRLDFQNSQDKKNMFTSNMFLLSFFFGVKTQKLFEFVQTPRSTNSLEIKSP